MHTQHEHVDHHEPFDPARQDRPAGGALREQRRSGWRLPVPSVFLLFLLLGILFTGTASCTPEQLETQRLVNVEREAAGLPALLPSPHATAKAQAWAETMAGDANLRHSNLAAGMPAGFLKIGENVGRGPELGAIHDAFMRSPSHRANVLDPAYQWIGTGTARSADGVLYVAVVFARY